MNKDIDFPEVKGVYMAITCTPAAAGEDAAYHVYILNENKHPIYNVLVNSTGYSDDQRTSTLRHYVEQLKPGESFKLEAINPELFSLVNQFWVSYYIDQKIYDKKFIFLPGSIVEENFSFIEKLDKQGVLHT